MFQRTMKENILIGNNGPKFHQGQIIMPLSNEKRETIDKIFCDLSSGEYFYTFKENNNLYYEESYLMGLT